MLHFRLESKRDNAAGGELWKHTRIMSKHGRKKRGSPLTRGKVEGKRHISERPEAAQSRDEEGHWEGDGSMPFRVEVDITSDGR